MEHITITQLKGGFFELVPEKGYILENIYTTMRFSEAITRTPEVFRAVLA